MADGEAAEAQQQTLHSGRPPPTHAYRFTPACLCLRGLTGIWGVEWWWVVHHHCVMPLAATYLLQQKLKSLPIPVVPLGTYGALRPVDDDSQQKKKRAKKKAAKKKGLVSSQPVTLQSYPFYTRTHCGPCNAGHPGQR